MPSAGSLISSADGRRLSREFGDGAATEAIKAALACMRTSMDISEDREVNSSRAISLAESRLGGSKGLTRVINATGVVLHTNLGRAPLSKQAVSAAVEAAVGYTNLEYDLEAGRRGSRQSHVAKSISSLLGAESAIVVNNNAAAVLLCLDALAKGKKVAVSRGELVEIGGSFRVPEIISATGAELVEVGTTNRTRAADYEKAAREGAAALLKVHPSNFKVTGFVSEAGVREVAEVASRFGIPFIFDMGSGSIADMSPFGLPYEPRPQDAIAQGADIVTFSGDKLMGGPQCGIIAGKAALVDRISKSPLARAFRVDKMRLAALSATLGQYAGGRTALDIPVLSMLNASREDMLSRARRLETLLKQRICDDAAIRSEIVDTLDEVGGGSLPGAIVKGIGLKVGSAAVKPSLAALRMRQARPAAVALERAGGVVFSMRTVRDDEVGALAEIIAYAFCGGSK